MGTERQKEATEKGAVHREEVLTVGILLSYSGCLKMSGALGVTCRRVQQGPTLGASVSQCG